VSVAVSTGWSNITGRAGTMARPTLAETIGGMGASIRGEDQASGAPRSTHTVGPQPFIRGFELFRKRGAEYLTAEWMVNAGRMMDARPWKTAGRRHIVGSARALQ
jgi:hypothetical protein